jgi:hypothetical protein
MKVPLSESGNGTRAAESWASAEVGGGGGRCRDPERSKSDDRWIDHADLWLIVRIDWRPETRKT